MQELCISYVNNLGLLESYGLKYRKSTQIYRRTQAGS
jgi:hypothetical protein